MTTKALAMLTLAALLSCQAPGPVENPPPPDLGGGPEATFDHLDEIAVDPFEVLATMQKEGPREYTARLHGCSKLPYATLGAFLTSRGVNLATTTAGSAGAVYQGAAQSLGVANYPVRVREAIEHTTTTMTKMFDVFAAAAPEIIAAMPNLAACKVDGVGAQMFDAGGCRADGIACLLGQPATQAHLDLCNQFLGPAADPSQGQRIVVAALLAAHFMCE